MLGKTILNREDYKPIFGIKTGDKFYSCRLSKEHGSNKHHIMVCSEEHQATCFIPYTYLGMDTGEYGLDNSQALTRPVIHDLSRDVVGVCSWHWIRELVPENEINTTINKSRFGLLED